MKNARGFTLIELLITLVVAAILLSIAVPNFGSMIKNDRQSAQLNTLLASMNLARSDAVKSGTDVLVCASSDGKTCSGAWTSGWSVQYVTPPAGADTYIQVYPALAAGNTLKSSAGNNFIYHSTGMTNLASPATFTLCDSRGAAYARAANVSITGAPEAVTSIGKDANGNPLTCP